ncbi:MAG: M67 family metallopeptidase [Sphingomonadales bacterium]
MIRLPSQVVDHLENAARHGWPYEVCGFLIGRSRQGFAEVVSMALSPNRADDPASRFLLDPAMHLRLQRELRGSDFSILGVFHSHPGGEAALSAADCESQAPGDWIWIVSALDAKDGECRTRGFRLTRGGTAEEVELRVTEC